MRAELDHRAESDGNPEPRIDRSPENADPAQPAAFSVCLRRLRGREAGCHYPSLLTGHSVPEKQLPEPAAAARRNWPLAAQRWPLRNRAGEFPVRRGTPLKTQAAAVIISQNDELAALLM